MKNWHWIAIGAVIGLAAGSVFGFDYALAGMGLGLAAGVGVVAGMGGR